MSEGEKGTMSEAKNHRDVASAALFAAFGQEYKPEDTPLIDDLLAWQLMIDNAPASINLRGAHRFWTTVSHYLGRPCFADGSPDMHRIVIPLTDTVGLQLTADFNKYTGGEHQGEPVFGEDWNVYMDYRFVPLDGEEWYSP